MSELEVKANFLADRLWSMCTLNEIDPDKRLERLLVVNPEVCDLNEEDKAWIRKRVLELIEPDRKSYMVNGADLAGLRSQRQCTSCGNQIVESLVSYNRCHTCNAVLT